MIVCLIQMSQFLLQHPILSRCECVLPSQAAVSDTFLSLQSSAEMFHCGLLGAHHQVANDYVMHIFAGISRYFVLFPRIVASSFTRDFSTVVWCISGVVYI